MVKPTVNFRTRANALKSCIVLKLTKWIASFSLAEVCITTTRDSGYFFRFNQKALSDKQNYTQLCAQEKMKATSFNLQQIILSDLNLIL